MGKHFSSKVFRACLNPVIGVGKLKPVFAFKYLRSKAPLGHSYPLLEGD